MERFVCDTTTGRFVRFKAGIHHVGDHEHQRQFLRVLRKAALYLRIQPSYCVGYDTGEEVDDGGIRQLLGRTFRKVWLNIATTQKKTYRKDILDYWRKSAAPLARISMTEDCPQMGSYETNGKSFEFNCQSVKLAAEKGVLEDLIAHELAHAWHDTQPASRIRKDGAKSDGAEQEANDLSEQWGYSMKALEKWRQGNKEELQYQCGVAQRPVPYIPFDALMFDGV
jgi:hypothetical protein